jgi:uncharacterized protein
MDRVFCARWRDEKGKEQKMVNNLRKNAYFLLGTVAVIAISALASYWIERGFGKVDVQVVRIADSSGSVIVGKLFRPVAATPKNKMPGIMNLHGGANDKGCQDAVSIELARRGFVVLETDGIGHGDSGGAYEIMRVFGDPTYTFGATTGYAYLKSLSFVDTANMGVTGHSMGGGNAIKLANMDPDVRAIASVDGGQGSPANKNVLFIQPRLADMGMTGGLVDVPPVLPAPFGLSAPVEWGRTYGDFAAGTARRAVQVPGNHHTLTLQPKAVSEIVDWFHLSIAAPALAPYWMPASSLVYMWKEILNLLALLATLVSLIPLTNLLLASAFFKPVAQPIPAGPVPSAGSWWAFATINALVAGAFYLLFAPYGGTIVSKVIPGLNMLRVEGIAYWFVLSAIVGVALILVWYFAAGKKSGVSPYDLGISFDRKKVVVDWGIIGKTALIGALLFAWMYSLVSISQSALGQEFRFGWPFMRQFADGRRFGMFLVNLLPALIYFIIGGGVFMFGQIKQKEYGSPAATQLVWWLKVVYASLFGLFLVWAIQYLPWMIAGTGPLFANTIDKNWAVWPLLLWMYIPEFAVLMFFLTWFYRRTGRIYLGALMVSVLAVWFMTAGLNFTKLA